MTRTFLLSIVLLAGMALTGCDKGNPGTWDQNKVEEQIKQSLNLTDVALTPNPAGGYTGRGTAQDGESLRLTITQDPATQEMAWDAVGDRGTVTSGEYNFK